MQKKMWKRKKKSLRLICIDVIMAHRRHEEGRWYRDIEILSTSFVIAIATSQPSAVVGLLPRNRFFRSSNWISLFVCNAFECAPLKWIIVAVNDDDAAAAASISTLTQATILREDSKFMWLCIWRHRTHHSQLPCQHTVYSRTATISVWSACLRVVKNAHTQNVYMN